jgi:hypothetical protein
MAAARQNFEGSTPQSWIAGGAITANRLVMSDTTEGQVIATTGITSQALAVSLHTLASGDVGDFQTFGVAKLEAAAAISLNDEVMPDSGGGGKIATSSGATARSVGIALQAAGGGGEIIMVKLALPVVKGPANS